MILDTDILIALLKGDPKANKAIEHLEESGEQVATTILTAYELLRGACISSKPEKNLPAVQELLSNIEVLLLTLPACEEASKIYRDLRKVGCLIGEFDTLIAAIAKTYDETIMTRDSHYTLIRGTEVKKW